MPSAHSLFFAFVQLSTTEVLTKTMARMLLAFALFLAVIQCSLTDGSVASDSTFDQVILCNSVIQFI